MHKETSIMYPTTNQVITSSGTSQASSAMGAQTYVVRIATSGNDIHVAFGAAPTATTSSMVVQDGNPELFKIRPGEKVAVLQIDGAATVSITEMTN